jgi:hypothetical protein
MKNWDWRPAPAPPFAVEEEEFFLLRSVMMSMVCRLEGRRNKVGPEKPTDEEGDGRTRQPSASETGLYGRWQRSESCPAATKMD